MRCSNSWSWFVKQVFQELLDPYTYHFYDISCWGPSVCFDKERKNGQDLFCWAENGSHAMDFVLWTVLCTWAGPVELDVRGRELRAGEMA